MEPICDAFKSIILKSGECKLLIDNEDLNTEVSEYKEVTGENSIRTVLTLQGTPEEFMEKGGATSFKLKLWSSLELSASQV